MKATIKLEAIGDGYGPIKLVRVDGFNIITTKASPPCWVAKITGEDNKYGLAREFVAYKKDYSSANSVGSRGVFLW